MIKKSKPNKNSKRPKKKYPVKTMVTLIWSLFLLGLAAVFLLFWGTSKGMLGEMPDVQELENPDIYVSSEIYSADGVLLDRFETEKRVPVTYDELPQHLVEALLAREDIRYKSHSGIDPRGTLRALTSMGKAGGASTISQQLAKLLFTGTSSQNKFQRAVQKLKEWVVAVELEKKIHQRRNHCHVSQ